MQTTVRRTGRNVILAVILFLVFAAPAQATERIVDQNAATCDATATPPCYRTIPEAIQAILNENTPGDSIMVEPGEYPQQITLTSQNVIASISGRVTAATRLTGGGSGTIITAGPSASTTIRNFTFTNAATGIQVSGNSSLIITGNVFYNITGPAVSINASAATSITNNTFRNNTTAILSNVDLSIKNNIFSSNTTALTPQFPLVTFALVTYCAFHNNGTDGIVVDPASTTSTNIPNSTHQAPDPLFVDPNNAPPALDLHLRSGSPCIDTGSDTNRVNPPAPAPTSHDMGAYGGPNSDNVPFAVSGVTYSTPTATSISLAWSPDLDYLVQGYRVHYGYSTGNYTGTDATDAAGNPLPSPIDAGNVSSFLISGLTRTVAPPAEFPVIVSVAPGNGSLTVGWTPVPGAASYNVYYQELPGGTVQQVNTASSAPSYTLTGLKNGFWYSVQVSALAQAAYYFAVTSYYQVSGADPGTAWESAYSAEQTVRVGPALEGPLSGAAQGAPDELIPAPNLQNTGCFIATAAYGSYDAPPVRVLRDFRDRFLSASAPGRAFIGWYYRTSPRLAEQLNRHPALKPLVRIALEPIVAAAYLLTESPAAIPCALLVSLAAAAFLARRRRRAADISRS